MNLAGKNLNNDERIGVKKYIVHITNNQSHSESSSNIPGELDLLPSNIICMSVFD